MGPKTKENTGAAFEDRVSSLFWQEPVAQQEQPVQERNQEQKEEETE